MVHNDCLGAAWHLYQQSGDTGLLRPTVTDDRIDEAWVSAPLAPAVSGYRLLHSPDGASDRCGLIFRLETDAISTEVVLSYR
ncbi:hypothetical protein ACWDG9_43410 [Streptomyces sp. NPDC001073]